MSAQRKPKGARPEPMSEAEAAREFFIAGYRQALDDVAERLAVPPTAGFLVALRSKAAAVETSAIIRKAAR